MHRLPLVPFLISPSFGPSSSMQEPSHLRLLSLFSPVTIFVPISVITVEVSNVAIFFRRPTVAVRIGPCNTVHHQVLVCSATEGAVLRKSRDSFLFIREPLHGACTVHTAVPGPVDANSIAFGKSTSQRIYSKQRTHKMREKRHKYGLKHALHSLDGHFR